MSLLTGVNCFLPSELLQNLQYRQTKNIAAVGKPQRRRMSFFYLFKGLTDFETTYVDPEGPEYGIPPYKDRIERFYLRCNVGEFYILNRFSNK